MKSLDHAESDFIKDKANPKSLVNITSTQLASKIAVIPEDVLVMKEADLEKHASVNDTERMLRAAFQQEYERAIRTGEGMETGSIYKGIVTPRYFYSYVMTNSFKLAYIIKPFADYQAQLEDMLQLGLDQMRKFLKRPVVNGSGEFDHKLAALQHKITTDLMDRRRGSASRKIEIESKSMNVNVNHESGHKVHSLEELDAKIRELEARDAVMIEHKDGSDGEGV